LTPSTSGLVTIALATPRPAASVDEGIEKVRAMTGEAAARGASIVCFPEAYLPGLRGQDFEVPPFGPEDHDRALGAVSARARELSIAVILGAERLTPAGRQIVACVLDENGRLAGVQSKNQIDPTEDRFYVPGESRSVFDAGGLRFGIAICHEGWRYPETVRWAAVRGAKVVFHPQHTGNRRAGTRLTEWGSTAAPYYERAMSCRALENTIFFASVNYALEYAESATSVIAPSGRCQAHLPYGEEGVLVETLRLEEATGLLASRWAPERHVAADSDPP
jgi:predicted amidohydrolase